MENNNIQRGDDVWVKPTGMQPIKPMNGQYYTETELEHYVGPSRKEYIFGPRVLITDAEGKTRGRLPNRIATGWIVNDGYSDWVAGDAILVSRDNIR